MSGLDRGRLLARATPADVELLLRAGVRQSLKPGELLFSEGDEGHSLWLVEQGRVEVVTAIRPGIDRVLESVGPGGVLGELGFIDGGPRNASARAAEPSEVLMLRRASFDDVASAHPALAAAVFDGLARVLGERLRFTTDLYRSSVLSWLEVTHGDALNLHHLGETAEPVTVHLADGSAVTGTVIEFTQHAAGWALTLKDGDRLSLVPYPAVVRIDRAATAPR